MKNKKYLIAGTALLNSFIVNAAPAIPIPKVSMGVGTADTPTDIVTSLQILLMLTILTLAPAIIMMTTAFIRIIIVLHFVRQAIGLQQVPPNQILIGLALFLTFFVMRPTYDVVMSDGVKPFLEKKITQEQFYKNIEQPVKTFMLKQTRTKDLELFLKISKVVPPKNRQELPMSVVVPSFIIGEMSRGFEIGILIYIPFIIIDMVVSTILMSLGMMMLPPVSISMPFKLLLFVMIDGWSLIIGSLVKSFN